MDLSNPEISESAWTLAQKVGVPPETLRRMVTLRRDLHRLPELSGEESGTAARLIDELSDLGLTSRAGVGGHGVVAEIPGASDGPAIAIRGDMDALPIQEETGLPFASVNPGVMHACGHDGHTSILMGAAELLLAGDPPPRPVRLLFQPSEELGSGASAMIKAGALEGVAAIFGGHLDRRYEAGTLIVTEGAVNASADMFRVTIQGRSGHGARPHEALDAVVVGSLMVMAIQTIVSREVDPSHPSVVSIGQFSAGTAANVIAGIAVLEGTIRAQEPEVRQHLRGAVARIARAIGQLHEAKVDIVITDGTPRLLNTPEMTALAHQAAVSVVGPNRVEPLRRTNMGGEDFAYFLERVPGCYIRYGAMIEGKEGFPAHSNRFDFDEAALPVAAAWLAGVARRAGAGLEGEAP